MARLALLPVAVLLAGVVAMDNHDMHGNSTELNALPDAVVCADGMYPLYRNASLAMAASPLGTAHAHMVGDYYTAYMPNGLTEGMSMEHGATCPNGTIDASGIFDLPLTAFCIDGSYPLFTTADAATMASPVMTAHTMSFGDYRFYMSNSFPNMTMMSGSLCPDGYADQAAALTGGHDHDDHDMHGDATELNALPDAVVCAGGMYPIYRNASLAMAASPLGTAHAHMVGDYYTAYMPNGLTEGTSMEHGATCPNGTIDASGIFDLPLTAFCIDGSYPLFTTAHAAMEASPVMTAHTMSFGDYRFYMSNSFPNTTMMSGSPCPDGYADQTAALTGGHDHDEGGGLSPGGLAAVVICSVLAAAAIVGVGAYLAQRFAKAKAAGGKAPPAKPKSSKSLPQTAAPNAV